MPFLNDILSSDLLYTLSPGLVNLYTLREPNIYTPYGFFLGLLATFLLCIPVFLSFVFCGEIN